MSSLIIENGHEANIKGFYQYPTYRNALARYPTRKINRQILKDVVAIVQDYTKYEQAVYPVYVIEPLETPLHYALPHNTWNLQLATFPKVTCIALLQCFASFKKENPGQHNSWTLAVVWFQDSYAFPIDALVLEQIKQIPWSEVASNEKK